MATYDVIVIGAGSIGVATAMALGKAGNAKTAVIERNSGAGQGQNNRAIGGIRAAHSKAAKILTCLRSIEIFSGWAGIHREDIGWVPGGYLFPAYRTDHEEMLKRHIGMQKSLGVRVEWLPPAGLARLMPGIRMDGLRGGTWSPGDGRASPTLAIHAFTRYARSLGVEFRFGEKVKDILLERGAVSAVATDKDVHSTRWVVNAAGIAASRIGSYVGIDLPVSPSLHRAGVTEAVPGFLKPLVVDIRSIPGCDNFYFFQNSKGRLVFTISPTGKTDGFEDAYSVFSERIRMLLPELKDLRIDEKWAGAYPMTPDGSPIVGPVSAPRGYVNAVGMGGQGFMSGPGVGELVARIIYDELTGEDMRVLESFSMDRTFDSPEALQ
jgi:sarcosine oxidase subunit beta